MLTAALQAEHMQMGGSSKGWTSSPSGPPCPFGLPVCGSTIQSLSVFVSLSFRPLLLLLFLFSSLRYLLFLPLYLFLLPYPKNSRRPSRI